MAFQSITLDTDVHGIARLTLSRAEIRNAFDDTLIRELSDSLHMVTREGARCLILTGAGKAFSAGADLNWMKRMSGFTEQENIADAVALADMLEQLNDLPLPTIAAVNGPAIAGGLGLIACCDIALSVAGAFFAVSEVRLGLIPATISSYLIPAIGERAARRYFLTAERFDAQTALRLGLVHELVDADALEARAAALAGEIVLGGPQALAATKALIRDVARRPVTEALKADTARRIALARVGAEGQEGLTAFFDKRPPGWQSPEGGKT